MHQLVKLTNAVWLLQLVISSSLIHELVDPNKTPTGIRTRVPRLSFQIERRTTYQLSYPSRHVTVLITTITILYDLTI